MSDDELLERALLDELSDAESEMLAGRLTAEPALARRMTELACDEAVLAEWAAERRALSREASPPPRWRTRPLVAAAAILVVATGASALWIRSIERKRDVSLAAEVVSVDGNAGVKVGDRLMREPIECPPGARVGLRYADGTTLEVRERTTLAIERSGEAREVSIFSGSVLAHVTPQSQGAGFHVVTPHARASVLGTRFEVVADRDSTRLVVHEGRVFFRDEGGSSVTVPAGQVAVAGRGRPIVSCPLRGTGLLGEYYDSPDLSHPKLSRLDPTVDFDWGLDAADPLLKKDGFSVRWSGRLVPRFSETHTFSTITDDGVRLWVDGKLLIDQFHAQTKTEHSATVTLEAWCPVDLRMEYLDTDGPAVARLLWSSPSMPRQVVPQEALVPPPTAGAGLKGEYFGDDSLRGMKFVRIDPTVDFAWGLAPPHPSMPQEHFSVRWTGQVEAAWTETITFTTVSDDGVRLWVDGQLLIDDWTVRGTTERSGRIDLMAGRRYDLKLEYFQCVSTANARLLWGSASQPQQVVPKERLFPAP